MKKFALTAALLSCLASPSQGAPANEFGISDMNFIRTGDALLVGMKIDASEISLKGNREIELLPILVNGSDSLMLSPLTIAGRNRYYRHLRNDAPSAPAVIRAGEATAPVSYRAEVDYSPWMENATLVMETVEKGCCAEPINAGTIPVAQLDLEPEVFMPQFAYISPKAETAKIREINARAYIDFPVNKTVIYPDYRRNPTELAKIRATIDSVRNDENLSITSIHIKGFASPEGTYPANSRLAEGRTAALSKYVNSLYKFPAGVMTSSFEPEDWQGLREFVASHEGKAVLTDTEGLLAIIDSPDYSGKDDVREAEIKKRFPKDYRYLLENVYPSLRHSDYRIEYQIRSFHSPEEILKVMQTAPQNLSLQEFYVLAQSQEPGSPVYNEAFETAVRMYPSDPVANLNAACSAMQRNDLEKAASYLEKAGDSEEAGYARAILAAMRGDSERAIGMIEKLPSTPQSRKTLESLKNGISRDGKNFIPLTDKVTVPTGE